jgi:DNA-binding protein HU-beta
MTKSQLLAAAAKAAGVPAQQAVKVVNAALDAIAHALGKGEKVQLIGFGTFEVRERKARTGINPRTQEKVKIKATKVPAFRAAQPLKAKVAGRRRAAKRA